MHPLLAELLDAVWPRRCLVCGGAAGPAGTCDEHVLPGAPPGPRCGRCAGALPPAVPDGARCAGCARAPLGAGPVVALADYRAQPAARAWVLALKHRGRRDLAEPLGEALARRLAEAAPGARRVRALVPAPLHPARRVERGYDQALLLARAAARAGGIPLVRALRRRRATAPQGAAGASSRAANVAEAFALRRGAAARLEGVEAWLVDDVVTSGATAASCAALLRRAGARSVGVLCVARAGERPEEESEPEEEGVPEEREVPAEPGGRAGGGARGGGLA